MLKEVTTKKLGRKRLAIKLGWGIYIGYEHSLTYKRIATTKAIITDKVNVQDVHGFVSHKKRW